MQTTLLEELRFGRHLLAFARDPSRLEHIRMLGEVASNLRDPTPALQIADRAMQDPGYRALYERGYRPEWPDLRALRSSAPDTLGRAYADHMLGSNLSVDFMQPSRSTDPRLRFLAERLLRTHDIYHVLTGYDTSKPGEIALQAFYIAQLPSGVNVAILLAGLLHLLRTEHEHLERAFDGIADAHRRGRRARFLLGVPWEERWHEPLQALRAEVGLEPLAVLPEAA